MGIMRRKKEPKKKAADEVAALSKEHSGGTLLDKKQKFVRKKLGSFEKKKEKVPREKKEKKSKGRNKPRKIKFQLCSPKVLIKKIQERSREKQDKGEFKRVEKVFFLHGIQFKLYSLIVIPILFLIVLGVVSYQKASTGIRNSYVESASSAVELTTSYYDFVFDTLKSDYNEIVVESKLRTYVNGGYAKMATTDGISYYNEKYKSFNYNVTDNKFLEDVYIVTDNDKSIATTNATDEDLYSKIIATDQGAMAAENNNQYFYFGTMPELDEAMKSDSTEYAIRMLRKIPKGDGFFSSGFGSGRDGESAFSVRDW